jgi:1-acyl-sn-glycerol-3-phosphate acyltransferase
VANHSSYLDGVVLYAPCRRSSGFVIKREMSRVPLANLLLRRIGAHSWIAARATGRARYAQTAKQAASGVPLAFSGRHIRTHARPDAVPVGAFWLRRAPGLVLPVAIRGSRHALPPGTLLPHPGHIEIEIAPAIPAPASTDEVHTSEAAARRQAILQRTKEPDLAPDG